MQSVANKTFLIAKTLWLQYQENQESSEDEN